MSIFQEAENLFREITKSVDLFKDIELKVFMQAAFYLAMSLVAASIGRKIITQTLASRVSQHHAILLRRLTFWSIFLIGLLLSSWLLGFKVGKIVWGGTALTIAAGFLAKTSISNVLSGILLFIEKPFEIGDFVIIENITGEILAIDLFSVKIRTRDNTLLRIPNESLLNSQFRNISMFPIRRFEISIKLDLSEDLKRVYPILLETIAKNPLCLEQPAPYVTLAAFEEYYISLRVLVWAKQSNYSDLEFSLPAELHQALLSNQIRWPHQLFIENKKAQP